MPKCFYCGVELDKTNRSLEHIIPNGIAISDNTNPSK